MFGGKDVENRSWPTNYRGKILIHASSRKLSGRDLEEVRHDLSELSGLPLSAVPADFERSAILGSVELVDIVEDARSPWAFPDNLHWLVRAPKPLASPVRGVNGKLQLWRWTPNTTCGDDANGGARSSGDAPPERAPIRADEQNDAHEPNARKDIDDIDVNKIMIVMRLTASSGVCDEHEFLRGVSRSLGFSRMGSRVEAQLKRHLRTAVKRGVLSKERHELSLVRSSLAEYDLDVLVGTIGAVLRRGQAISRADLTQALREHHGFAPQPVANDNASAAVEVACHRGVLAQEASGRVKRIA
jgi:hypothetical protein